MGGLLGRETELKVGKGKGVDGTTLPGIDSGFREADRWGTLIKRRQLGQRISL